MSPVPKAGWSGAAQAQGLDMMGGATRAVERAVRQQVQQALEPTLAIRNAYAEPPRGLALSPGQRYLAVITGDGGFRVFDLRQGQPAIRHDPAGGGYTALAMGADGRPLAGLRADGAVTVTQGWDAVPGQPLDLSSRASATALALADETIAVGHADGAVTLWQVGSGTPARQYNGTGAAVTALAMADDGAVVAGHDDGTVRRLAPDGGVRVLANRGAAIRALAIGDGGRVAVGDAAGRLRVPGDGTTWQAHADGVRALAFWRGRLISAGGDGAVRRWTLDGRRLGTPRQAGDGGVTGLAHDTAGQGTRLLVAGPAKAVHVLDPDGESALARLHLTRGGWGVVDRRGRFDGDASALEDIAWEAGDTRLPIDNLSAGYFEPGLLVKHLRGTEPFLTQPDNPVRDGIYPPPTVDLEVQRAPDRPSGAIEIEVRAQTRPPGRVQDLRLYHNGKRVPPSAIGDRDRGDDGRRLTLRAVVPAAPGNNSLHAVARGWAGIDSPPARATVEVPDAPAPARLRMTAVGINAYRGADLRLNYAVADAEAVASTFARRARPLFAEVETEVLLNGEATRPDIRRALGALQETRQRDVALVFLSGHARTVGDTWYFLPQELRRLRDDAHVREVGVSGAELAEALMAIPAQRLVLVIDTCQAGAILGRFAPFGQRRALHNLTRETGVVVIAASRADQQAPEYRILGHGLLTYTLLRGVRLEDGRLLADRDPADGQLTARELKRFVEMAVPKLALTLEERLAEQTGQRGDFAGSVPVTPVGLALGGDFALARE